MEQIGQLFKGYEYLTPQKSNSRPSERGSLIDYFTYKVNLGRIDRKGKNGKPLKPMTKAFVAMHLQKLTIRELYYLKSVSEDYESRGKPWGKFFWGVTKTTPVYVDNSIAEAREAIA